MQTLCYKSNYTYLDKIADLVKLTWKQLKLAVFWEKNVKIKKTLQYLNFELFQIIGFYKT